MKNRHRITCEEELRASGITIEQMAEKKRSFKDNLFRCLWNGLIIFLFTVGLTGMFASSFGMPCAYPVLIAVCAVSSFAFALLYVNAAIYNAGYFLLMFFIITSILRLYLVVNSGYNAVLNIMTEAVKEEMNLPYLRQHVEIYPDRQVTVTAFLAVIGSVLAMFFNMWVSRRKSIVAPLVIIFPVLELCIYLNDDFSYLSVALLLLAMFLFEITVKNDSVPMDKKKKQKTWHSYSDKDKTHVIVLHQEKPERRGGAAAAFVYVVSTLLLSALCFGFMSKRFINTDSALKKSSDRIVKAVAMHGIDGLFMRNNTQGRGGMSNGSFGDISSVYLDYETDLEISLVPYTDRPVYLPTYTGAVYDSQNRRWRNEKNDTESCFYGDTYGLLKEAADGGEWDKYKLINVNMLIKNIGVFSNSDIDFESNAIYSDLAVAGAWFSGYYSAEKNLFPIIETAEDGYTGLNYYACLLDYYEYENLDFQGTGSLSPESVYTEVPEDIREELSQICARQGFEGSRAEIIEQIQDFLSSGYGYTVSPGRTPSNRDFVLYFLQEKKQGFCVHFASSACLLLRSMGIPARYAEGYCFDYTVYEEAVAYEGDNTEWNTGYSGLDYNTPVTIELTDGNAHAWVEVYFEEVGWVPVEFTVGTVVENGGSGIMDFLGDIFGFGTGINTEPGDGQNFFTGAGEAIQNWFESRFGEQMLIVLAIAAGVLLLRYMIYIFKAYIWQADKRAVFQYRIMTKRVRKRLMKRRREKRDYYGNLVMSYDIMREILTGEYGVDADYADMAMSAYERYNYSGKEESRDIRKLTNIYRRLIRIITWRRIKKQA